VKNIYVVTHAEATHHIEGLVGGWYDSELTPLGRQHAERIGQRLRELVPDDEATELYASDLRRAYQTAEAIAHALGTPIQAMTDLREISSGEAEGRPQAWLWERYLYPPKHGARLDHRCGIAGAESRRELADRIYGAVERIVAEPAAHQVIVTHGFALTFVVAAWIGMPLEAADYINLKSNSGGITHLCEDDLFHNRAIVQLNDTSHLG
jgi:probable phosphoglycerate mutase